MLTTLIIILTVTILSFGFIILYKKKSKVFTAKADKDKVLKEDILKTIYNQNYENAVCDIEIIAGKLNKTNQQIENSVEQLKNSDLVKSENNELSLTNAGKEYALKIIRFHRLYEKYLADKTDVDEQSWHKVAEEVEHNLTQEEAEKLAAQIGNPVFDPHGDPIPSAEGELPIEKGIPLTQLNYGEISVVIHIEDEPHNIYESILNKGIYKGMQIRFLGTFHNEVSFYANEKLCSLSTEEANNIHVGIPKLEKIHLGEFRKLSSLGVGEKGKIIGIAKSLRGQQRRRLMDLGLVPGTLIETELESMTGDPIAYRIRGTTIALRKNQADKIYIEKI